MHFKEKREHITARWKASKMEAIDKSCLSKQNNTVWRDRWTTIKMATVT